jgi:hypothetical protein
VGAAQSKGQRILTLWDNDQVDMIRHQAVRLDANSGPLGMILQQCQIHAAIGIRKEDVLMLIAALSDVVRTPGDDYSC